MAMPYEKTLSSYQRLRQDLQQAEINRRFAEAGLTPPNVMPEPDAPIKPSDYMKFEPSVIEAPISADLPQEEKPFVDNNRYPAMEHDVAPVAPSISEEGDISKDFDDAANRGSGLNLAAMFGRAGQTVAGALGSAIAKGGSIVKPETDVGAMPEKLASFQTKNVSDKQKTLLESYKAQKEKSEVDYDKKLQDPNSSETATAIALAGKLGMKLPSGSTAASIIKMQPLIAQYLSSEALKEAARSRQSEASARREEKAEEKAKLGEKQIGIIEGFDSASDNMQDILSTTKNSYTGPIGGRIPNIAVSGDEAAFRAKVGRIVDQYRHLITGAAAGDKELLKVESRLPNVTDTDAQFKAKAKDYIKEVKAAKQRYLLKQQKIGKNVKEFIEPESETSSADKFGKIPGNIYTDKSGKRYKYLGNGKAEELD